MTAHFPLARLQHDMAQFGVKSIIHPGAQGRSANRFKNVGYYRGCQATVMHHTVSSGDYPDNDIAYILRGKGEGYVISNAYTRLDGTIDLLASGPTYTEGGGGPLGIIPKNRGNDVAFSNEMANWGTDKRRRPWTPEQLHAARVFAFCTNRIAADVWHWPDSNIYSRDRLFAHFEWAPTRKNDPAGMPSPYARSKSDLRWDMDWFRRDVAALGTTSKPPPQVIQPPKPSTNIGDEDMAAVLWQHPNYAEVFLIGAGEIVNVSGGTFESLRGRGVPHITDAHDGMLRDVLHATGRTTGDLTRV